MNCIQELKLVANRKYPKYQQLADAIIEGIHKGEFSINDKLPSVKILKETLKINAETVFNAYNLLKEKGFIQSDERRGFYVTNTIVDTEYRVFLLFDKLTNFKQVLYNSIINEFGEKASIDIFFHHHNFEMFRNLILSNIDKYSHFVIVTFVEGDIASILKQIPSHKLLLIDNDCAELDYEYSAVYQNFGKDIINGLESGLERIKKYKCLNLVIALSLIHLPEREEGFIEFCKKHSFDYKTDRILIDSKVSAGNLYILQSEEDISNLIKICKSKKLKIGKDIGIISYNQSPLLEFIEDGIAVMSSDFVQMGKTAVRIIMEGKQEKVENNFELLMRNSF